MANERPGRSGVTTFEHIESEIDAVMEEEQTVIHGDTGTGIDNASPINNHSNRNSNTPGNTRMRGYSGPDDIQSKDLATLRGMTARKLEIKSKSFT